MRVSVLARNKAVYSSRLGTISIDIALITTELEFSSESDSEDEFEYEMTTTCDKNTAFHRITLAKTAPRNAAKLYCAVAIVL
ncbi:uncharacterized protein LOC143192810 isoform X2 [Rhynchophorus ferrugineus]|uniref:uncharacterized protein LOC143192810 isoform X2 n=1 Tax=Rhynchophorus ferrugineus TaxID=354439 RepID=UPI003FCE9B82